MIRASALSLLVALLCISGHARAQPSPSSAPGISEPEHEEVEGEDEDEAAWSKGVSRERRRAAREIFLEGNRLFRVPLFARAAEQYTSALQTWKHPAFYFNLALAQLNLGQEVEARANLERALEYGQAPLGAEEYKEAQKQLRDLERQLGRVRITCKIRGAEVAMDGETLFTGPGSFEGWVKATPHDLTARRSGYLSTDQRIRVEPGTLQEIELKMLTLDEAADKNRRWSVWKPWAVVAAGTAIAAGGGALHALSARNFSAYDDDFLLLPCASMNTGCSKEDIGAGLNDRMKRAELQQKIAIGSYITGGALLATGAVLIYMNRPRHVEREASPGLITIVPELSGEAFGLSVSISH